MLFPIKYALHFLRLWIWTALVQILAWFQVYITLDNFLSIDDLRNIKAPEHLPLLIF